MASRTLTVVLAGDSKRAERAMSRTEKSMGKVSKATGLLKKAALAAGVAVAALAVAMVVKGVASAKEYQTALTEVATLLPDLSKKGFKVLSDDVIEFSDNMGIATTKVVPALYQAISAGVPKDNVFEFLKTAGKAAIGGKTDIETAVDGVTNVINAYKGAVSDARASDVLFTSVRLGKTTFEELAGSVQNVLPLANAMGIEFESVAAGWTLLTKAGIPTNDAMTKMTALTQAITAPTVRTAKWFDKLGIVVNKTRIAEEGYLPVLQEIMDKTGDNAGLQRKLFGSVEALQAAYIISSGEGAEYVDILDQMRNATGATDAAFNKMNTTVDRKMEKAMARFNNRLLQLGLKVLPFIADGLDGALNLFDNLPGVIGAVSTYLSPLTKNFGALASVTSERLGPVLEWLATNVLGPLVDVGFKTIMATVDLLINHLNGLALFLTGVFSGDWNGAWSALVTTAKEDGKTLNTLWNDLTKGISDTAKKRFDTIKTSWFDLWKAMGKLDFDAIGTNLYILFFTLVGAARLFREHLEREFQIFDDKAKQIGDRIGQLWDELMVKAHIAWLMLSMGWRSAWDEIGQQWFEGTRDIRASLDSTGEAIGGFFNGLGTIVRGGLDAIGETVGNFFSGLGTKVRGGLDAIGETVGNFFSGLGTKVRGALNTVGETVGNFFSGLGTRLQEFADTHEVSWSGLWDAVGAGAKFGVNAIIASIEAIPNAFIDGLNEVKRAWNAFSIRTPALEALGRVIIPAITYDTPNVPLTPQVALPRLARGGIVPHTPGGRAVVVGEGGQDEAIVPLGRRGSGAVGSTTINLNVTVRVEGGVITAGDLTDHIIEQVNLALTRGEISTA